MNKKLKTALKIAGILILVGSLVVVLCFVFLYFAIKNSVETREEQKENNSNEFGLPSLPCEPLSQLKVVGNFGKASFETNGSDIYMHIKDCTANSLFDAFDISTNSQILVYIGNIKNPLIYDHTNKVVANVIQEIAIQKGMYSRKIQLAPGVYSIGASKDCNIIIYSCEAGGVSDPKPVWR